ncbi:MAG: ribulose-phosphate 3-epimerase, partial [Gammaproteobacteria bacterium]|nr:ribulose-phosphate 3-epimerase [Gammaproteobacteria bacterium]
LIIEFAKAGATYISFHPEASQHIDRSLQLIHDNGCKAGLAFNPATPLDHLEYVWEKLDLILLMSVNPGFGGQKFIPNVLTKIKQLRTLIDSKKSQHPPLLEVDGGINLDNFDQIAKAGTDIFVAGSAIFDHKGQYKEIIAEMRKISHNQ